MPLDQPAGSTRISARAASAPSSPKTMGSSSDSRSQWSFRRRCGSPTSGRSETFSSCRRTDGSELPAPSSLPSGRRHRVGRTPPGRANRGRQRSRSPSLHRQRLRPDQGLPLTDAAARPRTSVGLGRYLIRRAPFRVIPEELAHATGCPGDHEWSVAHGRVSPELADLLRTATGSSDLCGPAQRLLL
jgi:hypothetical protein